MFRRRKDGVCTLYHDTLFVNLTLPVRDRVNHFHFCTICLCSKALHVLGLKVLSQDFLVCKYYRIVSVLLSYKL